MNKDIASPQEKPQQHPIDWKQLLIIGLIAGIVAGGLALVLPKWYNLVISFGMMLSSWFTVNRTKYRFVLQGFLASIVTGIIGWAIYMVIYYKTIPETGSVWMFTLTFMLPTIVMISGLGSWLFGRTRKRVIETQQKEEEERRNLKKQHMQSRPKKKYKKKK